MIEHLHFYYSNDLHSHFENWGNIVQYLNEKKAEHHLDKNPYWIVDIGDHVDRFHPISEAYRGIANVELLNQAGYDFATIGNNEGITLEYNDLYHLYDKAKFQVTCANLSSVNDKDPLWLQEFITTETESGIRIGLVGLTAPFQPFYEPLGWNVDSPYNFLENRLSEIKDGVDILILLSHLGLSEDQYIARQFPQIDVIIGGHTHHLLEKGEYINNTLITAAGKYGNYVGEVHLDWDHDQKKIQRKQAIAVNMKSYQADKLTEETLRLISINAQKLLEKPVINLESVLDVDWYKSTPLIEELTDHLLKWTKADAAMLNAGILLDGLHAGTVTYGDIHRICPHPINPCVVELRGIELVEVVRGAFKDELIHLALKGFGFRGKIIGKIIFSGIDYDVHVDNQGAEHVRTVYCNGKEIDYEKTYYLATADMFTFGKMFPEIARSEMKKFFLPEFMRDLLVDLLIKK
ncbi:2',3'-cyclic-nucleotide 2'-phosphodiesterase/5'-or 3'-nucleotidase, 5'-nucleotidase family [Gracilibacillus ureilyticus]|uniref:2',3'-cyclic-nucleotide 2'-phosphodiesterase/5'-or 3'-nucleotidase, 5'-nucleotidase family n=1 Tax=Gracilibacillus ureilyticus TaxID=531814 RepID=A0A1H9S0X9_9BACI|nr:bifunctional UDP-sugar hydrolase/5'-nucleotidase [Gracilibacillus ureilyticus]SER78692.1 2',3'-cyclic-nucleotide 2'-phosphodiesterase/5'-or 3'-nucleotidase, 5'-nucleotidase family [Gracilibacillus ureilyticus]